MTAPDLLTLVTALRQQVDPTTGQHFPAGTASVLHQPPVVSALNRLGRAVQLTQRVEEASAAASIPHELLTTLCGDLRALGYEPTVHQVANVLIGSRKIADGRLRGLPAYARYRGEYTRTFVRQYCLDFANQHPAVLLKRLSGEKQQELREHRRAADREWEAVDFFDGPAFDHLDDGKAAELTREVKQLGLRKTDEFLPEYMAVARKRYPRAYEPWTKAEKALLVEAMCYTNRAELLLPVFGRSVNSLVNAGKQLIFASQQRGRKVA